MPLAWDKQSFNAHDIDSMASQDTELDAVPPEKEEPNGDYLEIFLSLPGVCYSEVDRKMRQKLEKGKAEIQAIS